MPEAISVSASIDGLEDLLKQLADMGVNVRKATTAATRYAAQAIQEQAEANARAISSQPGRKVTLKVRFRRKGDPYAVASVYPAKGHAELRVIEYGTRAGTRWALKKKPFTFIGANGRRVSVRRIKHPGTPARPWLRPAFDQKSGAAVERYGELLQAVIDFKMSPPADNGDA